MRATWSLVTWSIVAATEAATRCSLRFNLKLVMPSHLFLILTLPTHSSFFIFFFPRPGRISWIMDLGPAHLYPQNSQRAQQGQPPGSRKEMIAHYRGEATMARGRCGVGARTMSATAPSFRRRGNLGKTRTLTRMAVNKVMISGKWACSAFRRLQPSQPGLSRGSRSRSRSSPFFSTRQARRPRGRARSARCSR